MKVTAPSGLGVEVRKLLGAEANLLADRKAARKGTLYDKILKACVTGVHEPGPYTLGESGALNWDNVLVADRFYILVAIRVATYGSEYVFKSFCNPCDEDFEWQIDILKDLEIYDIPEDSIEKFKAGDNNFETTLGEDAITFKLLTGKDEREAGQSIKDNKDKLFTTSLASRITKVNGKRLDSFAMQDYLSKVGVDEQLALIDSFDEYDGGIEQRITIECPSCGREVSHSLPFEGGDFWTPSKRLRVKPKQSEKRKARKRTFG